MSKIQRSSSRTHSRSASRSRSHSDSRSRSRSSSRSRSRKHRYSSRSRSRSRSHSPAYGRERKHPRDFQNHREFQGYHRGFRRPYYFRGRGRGFFRGRFQRGGGNRGGGGGHNNRQNWQNFRQYPQQKQQQKQQQQYNRNPKRGHSRSCSPKKSSDSPVQSRSHSHRSDRSSSPHSHHSSSSSSSRKKCASAKLGCKVVREGEAAPNEIQKNGGADATLAEQAGCPPEAEAVTNGDTALNSWTVPNEHGGSPKRPSPHVNCDVATDQGDLASSEMGSMPVSSGATTNGSTCWKTVASAPSTVSMSKKSPMAVFSNFGIFSHADQPDEDTVAISLAFKKFLEEQKSKKQAAAEFDKQKIATNGETQSEKKNSKPVGIFDRPTDPGESRPAEHIDERRNKKHKPVDAVKAEMPPCCSLNRPQFFCEDREEEDDDQTYLEMRDVEHTTPKSKSKAALSARELFEEHISRLEDIAWDEELEAFLLSRKQERAASILAALSKREKLGHKCGDVSSEKSSKVKQKEKTTLCSSPTYTAVSRRSSENREQEIFMTVSDMSPPRPSGKRGTEFNLRMESLSDDRERSSVMSNDWKNAMDLVHPHSLLQHLTCNHFRRGPSELFAQHVVEIVHHIKAQHFPSSGMTLNDRFAMYQRMAAEKEITKQRKSPEIHRRIDVSPSAFKRHSVQFDELKSSVDSSFKVDGKQLKGDTMDLRLDIERRKKYLSGEKNDKQEGAGKSGECRDLGVEKSTEKSSKHHKKSKKNKKKRERSDSSSSSSSSLSHDEEVESMEEGFSQAQLQLRECIGSIGKESSRGGFHFRIRGRGWNRMNCLANNINGNGNPFVPVQSKDEEWDPEDMHKNTKYYLQNKKDEAVRKWAESRGHIQTSVPRVKGRFILRRPTSSITSNNPGSNWSYAKFQASGDDGEKPGNSTLQNHKEQNHS